MQHPSIFPRELWFHIIDDMKLINPFSEKSIEDCQSYMRCYQFLHIVALFLSSLILLLMIPKRCRKYLEGLLEFKKCKPTLSTLKGKEPQENRASANETFFA